jgi:exopolysaccharide production protein ExoQ
MLAFPFLILSIICGAWALSRELKRRPGMSKALWIPTLFVAILGSRSVSHWIEGTSTGISNSPLDEAFFVCVMGGSLLIATSKGVNWGRFFRLNLPLLLVYGYFALSVIWSDAPLDSGKRIVKDFALLFVIAAVMSEKKPMEAIRAIFIRCACFIFPVSLVCNHYFPSIGRGFGLDGSMMLTGVTEQKNTLGEVVFVFSTMIAWDFLERRQVSGMRWKRALPLDQIVLLAMGVILLFQSESKTALIALLICIVLSFRRGRLASRSLNLVALSLALSVPILVFFTQRFGEIIRPLVEALGRDMTFTGRTAIWEHITLETVNPILGCGYWNFWGGPGGKAISDMIHWPIPNAHCGYLDIYLDGGICGLIILTIFLVSYGFRLAGKDARSPFQLVRFGFFAAMIFHNQSESSFFRMGLLWFATLLMIVAFPMKQRRREMVSSPTAEEEFAGQRQDHVAVFAGFTPSSRRGIVR